MKFEKSVLLSINFNYVHESDADHFPIWVCGWTLSQSLLGCNSDYDSVMRGIINDTMLSAL